MRFKFTLAGEDLGELDVQKLTLKQAFAIKAESGLTPRGLFQGLEDGDPDALQTIVWFLKFQKGDFVSRTSLDFALADLVSEQIDEDPAADPTPEASATSAPAETSTSGS